MTVTASHLGVDLKRHIVEVVDVRRNAEGDSNIEPWSAPTWKSDATVFESFSF
jgi:hypothetical protein